MYHSHHGPIIRAENGKWIAIKLLQDPVPALEQSYLRTKTTDYAVVPQDAGHAHRHVQQHGVRRRGRHDRLLSRKFHSEARSQHSISRTRSMAAIRPPNGRGLMPSRTRSRCCNPSNGWLFRTPITGPSRRRATQSPKRENYPRLHVDQGRESARHSRRGGLENIHDVTLDSLIAAGYDGHLTAFDVLLPPLFAGLSTPCRPPIRAAPRCRTDSDSARLEPAHRGGLRARPRLPFSGARRCSSARAAEARDADEPVYDYLVDHLTAAERIDGLSAAVAEIAARLRPMADRRGETSTAFNA